jgi:hypothetical protein
MKTTEQVIDEAIADSQTLETITRADGTSFLSQKNYGYGTDGRFQVYVVPVQQRTKAMRPHYRVTFYVDNKRTNKAAFLACKVTE